MEYVLVLLYFCFFDLGIRCSFHAVRFERSIKAQGVTINVKTVAKLRPNTIVVDSETHHCVDGAPTVISRVRKSIFV